MDEEEGFCIEKTEVTTDYRTRFLERSSERNTNCTADGTSQHVVFAPLMNSAKLQYLASFQNCLINQQLREEWAQRALLYTPRNRIVYNNVEPRLEVARSRSTLVFDSQFEGGNLDLAIKSKSREYDLYIRPDTNTHGNFQWFYFKVSNTLQDQCIRFNIRNISRHNPLYSQGLAPYACSTKAASSWRMLHPTLSKVLMTAEDNQKEWCLSFEYTFMHDHDEVGFACQPPYTHELLTKHLTLVPKVSTLCSSLLGLSLPQVIIAPRGGNPFHSVGLAIARQHPGEAVGSWMMHGFLNEMLVDRDRETLWIVVPMVNPDGVFLGNSRTGLAGYDYNRLYNQEQPVIADRERLVPEVTAILNLVKKLKKKYGKKLKLFVDFHGHSSRQNVFTYGPPYTVAGTQEYVSARLLPQLIASKTTFFRAEDCSYNIPKVKRNTARSILFNKFKIPYVYTVESSFGVSDGRQIGSNDLMEVGGCIAQASLEFLRYLDGQTQKTEVEASSKCLVEMIKFNMTSGVCREKMESESEDSSFEQEVASPRKTPTKVPQTGRNNATLKNKEFTITRQSVYHKNRLSRIKTSEDDPSDEERRELASHRYRITTESVGLLECMQPLGHLGQLGQRTSAKPLKRFVPRLQMLSRFERAIPSSPYPISTLMNQTTKHSDGRNLGDLDSKSVSKPSGTSRATYMTSSSPDRRCPIKRKPQSVKHGLLEQLSRNSKNKIGTQMLIINEF